MYQVHIPTLNGWRAVAVLMVIGAHSVTTLRNTGTIWGTLLAGAAEHAGVGVDLFFAISGFLICSLLLNEKDKNGFIFLRGFYIRRVFRILPALAVFLLILSILKASNILPEITNFELIAAGMFFRNYVDGSWYTLHFWSLAVEEHFYIFVPLMLSILSWKSALQLAILIAAASCFARWLESDNPGPALYFNTECRIDAIMYGAILALLLRRNDCRIWLEKNLTFISLIACVALAGALIGYFHGIAVRRTVIALTMPLPIAFTVLRPTELLGRFLELPALQWVGKISYSLYVWQMLFLTNQPRELGIAQEFPLSFVLALACAIACHYLLETPATRMGRDLAKTSVARNEILAKEALEP